MSDHYLIEKNLRSHYGDLLYNFYPIDIGYHEMVIIWFDGRTRIEARIKKSVLLEFLKTTPKSEIVNLLKSGLHGR